MGEKCLNIPHIFIGDTPIVVSNPDGFQLSTPALDEPCDFDFKPTPFEMEVELNEGLRSWDEILKDKRMDVIISCDKGGEVRLPNVRITNRLRVTRRIPRKMKKRLKKAYGDM